MADVLETELNNLIFRAQRAQAEFNAELGFVERLEQAANALREVRLQVMSRMAGETLPPPPQHQVPQWASQNFVSHDHEWRQ